MSEDQRAVRQFRIRWPLAIGIVACTLLFRILPYMLYHMEIELRPDIDFYPWNFTPVFAVCLFCGAFWARWNSSYLVPLATLFVSDLGIWILTGRLDWAFYPAQAAVYLSLVICTSLGFGLRDRRSTLKIAGCGLLGCSIFFAVTNFAVWLLGTTYPHTATGLIECYVAALPFFRNSLAGTAFFGAVLFSPFCVHEIMSPLSGVSLPQQSRA